MSKRLVSVLLAAFAWTLVANAAQKVDTLRILAIGNSFSEDAVENNLHDIGIADGRCCAIIGNMYIGGCSLERHWNNMKNDSPAYRYRKIAADGSMSQQNGFSLAKALKDEDWDVISLQQCSPLSGKWDTYEPYLGELLSFIKENSRKDVRLMWHQTWAYDWNSTHGSFPNYDKNQTLMYNAIVDASRKACEKYGLEIIPCGTAIQNVRATFIGDNVTRDGYHLNYAIGRYTAACTWFSVVFRRRVIGNSWVTPHMTHEYQTIAQEAAYEAVNHPYCVTFIGDMAIEGSKTPCASASALPDPLLCSNGKIVKNARQWEKQRRSEILSAFETEVYGQAPGIPADMAFEVVDTVPDTLGGTAAYKKVVISFDAKKAYRINLNLFTPKNARGPVPVFLCEIDLKDKFTESLMPDMLKAGYGVAFFCSDDVDRDWDDCYGTGIHKLFFEKGQKYAAPDEWGSIAAWSWGFSRVMDYLETDPEVNAGKVAVMGSGVLGKAALWAGAADTRFAMVVANESGCGGAAISRRAVGETIAETNRRHNNWFCDNFKKYGNWENALPVDQHELIALIAPRPVCIICPESSWWADPEGEKIALDAAAPVYNLYGKGAKDALDFNGNCIELADKFLK